MRELCTEVNTNWKESVRFVQAKAKATSEPVQQCSHEPWLLGFLGFGLGLGCITVGTVGTVRAGIKLALEREARELKRRQPHFPGAQIHKSTIPQSFHEFH